MKRARRRSAGKPALELIEEAVHLLRTAPTAAWAVYFVGSVPFVLGLLYFWADMSRSPFARSHLVETALGVSLLFLWMKFCHALFARRLRVRLAGGEPNRLGFKHALRIALLQTAVQPTGLFLLPLAAIPALPLAWMAAFYQNATVLADGGEQDSLRRLLGRTARQTTLWPGQNHLVLACLSLFALFVLVNCIIASVMLPGLIKSLFGLETVFSRGGLAMLNTTFFAAMLGLTYLCVDPIIKAVYVLRCFYGEAIASGADLQAELRHLSPSARGRPIAVIAAAALLAGVGLLPAQPAEGQRIESPTIDSPIAARESAANLAQPPRAGISPHELDRAIADVIQQKKYTWRLPREVELEEETPAEKGLIAGFFSKLGAMFRRWIRAMFEWLAWLLQKLFWRNPPLTPAGGSGPNWELILRVLLYALGALVLGVIGFMIHRLWRQRRKGNELLTPETALPTLDVSDENVGADQLPEDGWTKLARELLARGEYRLALRAFYLASLAQLAERNLVTLARFKSNRDYERELQRRAHAFPGLLSLFGENVSVFDRVWYGTHAVSDELVGRFAANVERMKAGG